MGQNPGSSGLSSGASNDDETSYENLEINGRCDLPRTYEDMLEQQKRWSKQVYFGEDGRGYESKTARTVRTCTVTKPTKLHSPSRPPYSQLPMVSSSKYSSSIN